MSLLGCFQVFAIASGVATATAMMAMSTPTFADSFQDEYDSAQADVNHNVTTKTNCLEYRDDKINGPARCMLAQGFLVKKQLRDLDAAIAATRRRTQRDREDIKRLDAENQKLDLENAKIAKDIEAARKTIECVAILKEYKKSDLVAFKALGVNRQNVCDKAEVVKRLKDKTTRCPAC